MSYIEPNSTIQLYRNIPIDTSYNDTLYFDSASSQNAWFSDPSNGYFYMPLEKYSYVRKTGRVRIETQGNPSTWAGLMQVDYMRFKNTSFENRWFYAFVTSVDYINNNTAEISFMIDTIQTWLIGTNAHLNLPSSYVLRQTDGYDAIGTNIEPEPIELGEYVSSGKVAQLGFQNVGFIVAIVDTDKNVTGGFTAGVYTGATLYYYTSSGGIDAKINEYIQKPESILAIYAVPALDVPDGTDVTSHGYVNAIGTCEAMTMNTEIDGYIPHNQKCYTYPYNFLRVFTYEGNYADFRYEFFKNQQPKFEMTACISQPVKAVVYGVGYKQHDTSTTPGDYPLEGTNISSYPVCSWNTDTYASWVAQNSVPMNNLAKAQEKKVTTRTSTTRANESLTGLGGLAGMVGDLVDRKLGSGIATGVNTLISMAKQENMMRANNKISNIDFNTNMQNAVYSASIEADTIHGTIGSGNLLFALNKKGFYAVRMYQPNWFIRKVDKFFDMYGYAVNTIQKPDLNARPHWTYVRVSDIHLGNNLMPADALNDIKDIFQNGIRFWKHASEVGNFSLDNRRFS